MARHDPLHGITRLIVDGSNQRERGAASSAPVAEEAVVPGLRAVIPIAVEVHVVFDTDPPIGAASVRSLVGVTVHHAGAGRADDAIVRLTAAQPATTLVVSDDAELRRRAVELGAQSERNGWLRERRQVRRPPTPSVGRPLRTRATTTGAPNDAKDAEDDVRPGWRPGRGATVKRGNPRRQAKRR
jgi:hypothetical protein